MSSGSHSRPHRRLDSVQRGNRLSRNFSRNSSRARSKAVSYSDAYTFALRVAYLHHLLQIRPKKKQYVPPAKTIRRATAGIGDMMKDFTVPSAAGKTKFPHGFMAPLERRMQGVVIGTEKLPGYNDANVKRSFAEAYTAFTETSFKRQMDKERRFEGLVLIFYSNATKALSKGKAPDDESWRPLVDRHLALFVRLFATQLRDQGSDRDRPELMLRLKELEKKLLTNEQDLTASTGDGPGGTYIEVTTPISYDVKDMPMVLVVAQIFGLRNSQVQSDIDAHKENWTEAAALTDLKTYQHCLDFNTRRTLRSDDFDLDSAYQSWKRSEAPELSQMMAEILRARPELLKLSSGSNKPLPPIQPSHNSEEDRAYSDLAKSITSPTGDDPFYSFDQPVDMSALSLNDVHAGQDINDESPYTFIPPEPRSYYKAILTHAMTFDQLHAAQPSDGTTAPTILSRQSIELLSELGMRWRIPQFSRLILLLDATVQKFNDQEVSLEVLEAAFEFIRNPPVDPKRSHAQAQAASLLSFDPSQWTVQDFALYRNILSNLNDALLRDLYNILQHCYDTKPPSVGHVLHILGTYVHDDMCFSFGKQELEDYKTSLADGLKSQADLVYRGYLEEKVPQSQEEWEFYHVIELGKAVVKLCERIQKRYRKNPEVMGINPLTILVETMFPSFENDANDLIQRILFVAHESGTEVDLQDGWTLYKELKEIRQIHHAALPGQPFAFSVEELLAEFVWRWIVVADERMPGLIEGSIKEDNFQVRSDDPEQSTDDERHSTSIVDIFRLFNQTVDEIFRLEWDNDLQYARFMTAMSKSFGAGLANYCEILETRFNKEMDRLTPEQEAAQTQTKQEKWMQYAKDAWNNREKVEPFQFYPEVCSSAWYTTNFS